MSKVPQGKTFQILQHLRGRADRGLQFLSIGIVLVIATLFYFDWRGLLETNIQAQQARITVGDAWNVMWALTEAESAERGYLLTGDSRFRDDFEKAKIKLAFRFSRLRKLSIAAKRNGTEVAKLGATANQKIEELAQGMRVRDERGADAALALLGKEDRETMDDARRLGAAIADSESSRTQERNGAAAQHVWTSRMIIFLGCLVLIVSLFVHGHFVDSVVAEREKLARSLDESRARLQHTNEALRESNADLEQFAYAASHDLQEPLRMVSIYTQLLREEYAANLDAGANSYIDFAVNGAKRMETLLRGLLSYSRIGSVPAGVTPPADANVAVREALMNLAASVQDNAAEMKVGSLPKVRIPDVQLVQLFQNLIGNALKYRKSSYPPGECLTVEIAAKRDGADTWIFSVRDNGIGIEKQYLGLIFGVFKRLHGQEYEGAGIGLALCQKIVERANGKIWAESEPGIGTTLLFTLPAAERWT